MINTSQKPRHKRLLSHALIASTVSLTLGAFNVPASHAVTFSSGDISGSFSSQLSLGASWRMEGQDDDLVSPGNSPSGRASSSVTDDGNLNFDNGDIFSMIFKGSHDLSLNYQNYGMFTRVRYWYDHELEEGDRPHGNSLLNYATDQPLEDGKFNDYAKSSGIELMDAYIYGSFSVVDRPLDVRLGRQVVSWGESTFIQNGINVINPVDVSALRKPGSELKEALLPVGMLYAAAGLTDALSMEVFYQYEWEKTVLDGCGNYFATNDLLAEGCDKLTAFSSPGDQELVSTPLSLLGQSIPRFVSRGEDLEADDNGQYGLSLRFFAENLNSTEFGLYYLNYHSRSPIFSGIKSSQSFTLAPLINGNPMYIAEYPEDIKLYGLSFSTTAGTWAISGEISHRPDMPLQINTTHIVHAIALGDAAPWSQVLAEINGINGGEVLHGYDEFEFTQIQFTFINFFDQILGAERLSFAAEVGANYIGGLPDTSERSYGRSPTYGIGYFEPFDAPTLPFGVVGNFTCNSNPTGLGIGQLLPANPQAKNCTDDGFITDTAWGYRLVAALDYSDLFAGINVKPKLAWSHNVDGYGPPPNFNEGDKALTLGVSAEYLNRYTGDISYTQYSGGDYNELNDRDFASLSFGVSF